MQNNLIDSNGGRYLTVDSLIEINNITTGSNNITLRKYNLKLYGFDKSHMDEELIEVIIIDQFNKRKITSTQFYSIVLNKIHPVCDRNGRTFKILFANGDII